jgi:23S rRNA (cytosine1962-C5)-methyltransferase
VLDRYAGVLVLKLYTAIWLPRLADLTRLIRETLQPERLVLRFSRNIEAAAREAGRLPEEANAAAESAPVVFLESGLRFEADVVRGQKTGFFLDQRENRRRVETWAGEADVLNAFSFSGGFSLYAARGGARSVTDLDISAHALAGARRNFGLNQDHPAVAACRHETIQTDVFAWLEQNAAPRFDLVILDPPSLAKREAERAGAIQAYAKLAAQGVKTLRPGGRLVAASCSAHVTADEFFEAVRSALRRSGRSWTELSTTGHPPDHPATFPEARYLKCVDVRV